MLVSDEKRKRTCATLNGGCKKFTRNAFIFWRAVQSIQSLWLALCLSLLCASWQTFSLARERRTSQKKRLTHGKESQCAKRLNDGLPEGEGLLHTESNRKMITDSYRLSILSSRCKLFKRLDNSYGFCIKRRIQGTFN